MKKLSDVSNYLVIENGIITEKEINDLIHVEEHKIIVQNAKQLQIIYTGRQKTYYDLTIEIAKNNQIDLIEMYDFQSDCQFHKHLIINQGCKVTRYVENTSEGDIDIDIEDHVDVLENANIDCAYVELANHSISENMKYQLQEEGARALIRLASLSQNQKKKSFEITLNHLAPYTYGDMDNYGIVKSKGSLIIDGIGRIYKGNHQSSTHQTNKIIVFDAGCNAQANPYLYIDEYDVKASHGASVGKIDEDHLYYLQSRGLSKQDAMHLVTYGYFLPVLNFIHIESLKERFSEVLKEKVGL